MNSTTTTIYLLFREYVDGQKAPSHEYIHGEEFAIERLNEDIWAEVRPLTSVLNYFSYERWTVLYDPDNLKALLYPANTLSNEYPNLTTAVLAQIKDRYTSWEDYSSDMDNLNYTLQTGCDISEDVLGDMARRQHSCSCAILHHEAVDTDRNGCVSVHCSNGKEESLFTFCDVRGMHGWVSENRMPKRQYHDNPKHGDANHLAQTYTDRKGIHRAAQLLTDTKDTNELLKYAVGINQTSDLWYYDVNNDCYIYFENEGNTPQLGFHAYHVHPNEENFDNIDIEKLRLVQNIP
jgi:hypothetical protein